MASRSIFSLRVIRCPACHARLPVQSRSQAVVVCEYCDARVELTRQAPRRAPKHQSSRNTHAARPHYSAFAWVLVVGVLMAGTAATLTFMSAARPGWLPWLFEPSPIGGPPAPASDVASVDASGAPPATDTPSEPIESREPDRGSAPRSTPASTDDPAPDAPEPNDDATAARPSPKARRAPAPTGPVLSVSDARTRLEPDVLACMRKAKVHRLLAYMGNSTVGPVHVLRDSRTRTDGRKTSLAGTKLGRCMDAAGAKIRARAFKSNYVRFELRNPSVPDPHADLPAKADRKEVGSIISAHDDEIHACARQHGEEGAREVFYFTIDGPTGKVLTVRASYLSRGFQRCAVAIYRRLAFPRVQEYEHKYTHTMQL